MEDKIIKIIIGAVVISGVVYIGTNIYKSVKQVKKNIDDFDDNLEFTIDFVDNLEFTIDEKTGEINIKSK